ncbi:MAG: hypothetical protein JWN89_774 [Parcubacteria group bacterium]|nr:hypothetical protein [Parcubacteria group bacterium]
MPNDPQRSDMLSDKRFEEMSGMFAVQRAIDQTGVSPTGRLVGSGTATRLGKVERAPVSQTEAYLYADKLNMLVVQEAFSGAKVEGPDITPIKHGEGARSVG